MSLVSVMMSTYDAPGHRRSQWLPTAIQSVLGQEGADMELLLLDNGSIPPVGEIQHPNVRQWRLEDNNLQEASRVLRRHVRGDYACWMCDDDELVEGWIKRGTGYLDANPGVGACWGGDAFREIDFPTIFQHHQCPHQGTIFRSEFLPIFDEYSEYITGDWMFWTHLASLSKLICLPGPSVRVRLHEGSHTEREGYGHGAFVPEHMVMWRKWLEKGHRPTAKAWEVMASSFQWELNYTRNFTSDVRREYTILFEEMRRRYV
jgi:hypothetical protein